MDVIDGVIIMSQWKMTRKIINSKNDIVISLNLENISHEGQFCVFLSFLITLNIHTRCGLLVTKKMMIFTKSSGIG